MSKVTPVVVSQAQPLPTSSLQTAVAISEKALAIARADHQKRGEEYRVAQESFALVENELTDAEAAFDRDPESRLQVVDAKAKRDMASLDVERATRLLSQSSDSLQCRQREYWEAQISVAEEHLSSAGLAASRAFVEGECLGLVQRLLATGMATQRLWESERAMVLHYNTVARSLGRETRQEPRQEPFWSLLRSAFTTARAEFCYSGRSSKEPEVLAVFNELASNI